MTEPDAASALAGVAGLEAMTPPGCADLRLWRVQLDRYSPADVEATLAPDERARAARFLHDDDRRRFQSARHALRRILGACLACDPADLAFDTGPFGKPRVAGRDGIEFNLSHSAGDCLIAVSREHAVGIDVERLSIVRDVEALARRHFTDRERRTLSQAAPADVPRAFLVGWTRKEACVKALGVGLSLPPSRIDAGCDECPREFDVEVAGEARRIALASLDLGAQAVGAFALVPRDVAAGARQRLA